MAGGDDDLVWWFIYRFNGCQREFYFLWEKNSWVCVVDVTPCFEFRDLWEINLMWWL